MHASCRAVLSDGEPSLFQPSPRFICFDRRMISSSSSISSSESGTRLFVPKDEQKLVARPPPARKSNDGASRPSLLRAAVGGGQGQAMRNGVDAEKHE
jgi:hypothetical protein